MVSGDLFIYSILQHDGNRIQAAIKLNPASAVYAGHFPGFPVTPGVCQLEMIGEILEGALGGPLRLVQAKNLKFNTLHEPGKAPEVEATIAYRYREDGILEVTGSIHEGQTTYFKLKGEYARQP